MTKDEVIALALATAQQKGWPEKLRISVSGGRKFFLFGPYLWWVSLISMRANFSAWITVGDVNGEIIEISTKPWKANRPGGSTASEETK